MKNNQRFTAPWRAMLSVSLVAALIAGCSGQGPKDSGAPEANSNINTTGYPVTKTPITLKVWAPINANATQFISGNAQNEAYQEMEKRTGIHIEWIHPAQGQQKEAFNLMVASGEFPDIIQGGNLYPGGIDKGVLDGLFTDLTPYMEKYAPDYYKLVNSNAEIKRQATNDAGKFPAFYMIKPEQDPPSNRLMFREDMLKAVNMSVPKTIDEYEKVFKAIKDAKGLAPYILDAKGIEPQFVGAYGVSPNFYLKDPKTVAFGQIQPGFKSYLTLMSNWYKAGYINKDFAGLKTPQIQSLFDSGKAATAAQAVVGTFNRGQQLKQNYLSSPYPRLKAGDKLHSMPYENEIQAFDTEAVIPTTSKNKIEAIRWLNYAYTKEGSMLLNYGVEGKTYTLVNGVPKYTDYILNHPKYGTENTNYILRAHFAPKLRCLDIDCNPNLAKSPESAAIRKQYANDPDVDSTFQLPPVRLTSEETEKRAKIMTEVNTYTDEMILKFILGAEPISKFDDFVAQLKKMGIDEAVKITQAAYDRYKNKK